MITKNERLVLCIVLVLACTLTGVLYTSLFSSRQDLQRRQSALTESRSRWEAIAAEKEELQAELKTVTNNLREARLSRSEAEARAAELNADIQALKEEISAYRIQKQSDDTERQ